MTSISTAVGSERVSQIVGYKITKGNFALSSPNLPQRIAILGEVNTANQSSYDTDPKQITTAQQAGEEYGFGSPIHMMMRILRPASGSGVGGVPTWVYPQAEPGAATAKIMTITPTGVATGAGTHTLKIAGRLGIDGDFYNITIEAGDTTADITQKIEDAINAVLGCPVTATSTDYEATVTTKWKGLTANDLQISVETYENDLGITYAFATTQAGAGTPSISAALNAFNENWNTIVVNSYGLESTTMSALEAFNGIPDPDNPTGRYTGIIMKPFIALTGSTADDPSATTDARKLNVTIAVCPAPLSPAFQFEAAANMAFLFARQAQDSPHLDVSNKYYPDMPAPTSIGSMASYENRDSFVKKGCSTVNLNAGAYQVQDFVTTYHPDGETPPQFRYCRNLMIDFNIRYTYYLKELEAVVGHTLVADGDPVSASNIVKPKMWKKILFKMGEDLADRALIADVPFFQESVTVDISSVNPDRFETFFKAKRTGFARISSTTAEMGFNFGGAS